MPFQWVSLSLVRRRVLQLSLYSQRRHFSIIFNFYNELQGTTSLRDLTRKCVQNPGEG